MLSIVIPVYNSEAYLVECVSSVLSQSYQDIEVILVDDGSNDGSGKICDDFARKDVRVKVSHQKNGGVSRARNAGIDIAEGEWISFVDSDDVVERNYASLFFSQSQHADLTFFPHLDFCHDREDRAYILQAFHSADRQEIEHEILHLKSNDQQFEFFGYTWNKFFRTDIIKKENIRFKTDLIFREDEVFTSEYCRHIQSLSVLPEVIYRYRRGTGGLTSKQMSSDDFIQLAKLTENTCRQFMFEGLVMFENYRIMYMYLDALISAPSFWMCYKVAQEVGDFHSRCKGTYDASRLPFGFVKNIKSPLRLLWWVYRRNK